MAQLRSTHLLRLLLQFLVGFGRKPTLWFFYGWRVSSKTTIVIPDAGPVTLNSDRNRGRGLLSEDRASRPTRRVSVGAG